MKDNMKKIFVAILAVAALLAAGCAKSDQTAPAKGQVVRVSAGAEELISKVASSTSGRFTWTKGDAIGIWTGSGITKFTLADEWAGFGYGEFVGELPEGGAITADSYAVYPYAEGAEASATSYTFPELDKWNTPASTYMLYAKGGEEKDGKYSFTFHHTTAYFRVVLKNIPATAGGLYIETADGGCYAKSVNVDFSAQTPAVTVPSFDESLIYVLPEHTASIESLTLILPIKAGNYAQNWGKKGLKFRIAVYSEPNWWSTKIFDYAGYFLPETEGAGYDVKVGEYYVFPEISYPNLKQTDDTGTGVNDGIEESVVTVQDPTDFWTITL